MQLFGRELDRASVGIALTVLSVLVFGFQDVAAKILVQTWSPFQVTMMRYWAFGLFSIVMVARQAPWINLQFRLVLGAAVVFSATALFMLKGGRLGLMGALATGLGFAAAVAFNTHMIWTAYGPGTVRLVSALFLASVAMAAVVPVVGFLQCARTRHRRLEVTSTADTQRRHTQA